MRRTTLRELGQNLPIGFLEDGKLQKGFTVRPYKARIDRLLGHWREANEGQSIAYLVAKFIAMITERAGPHALALTQQGDSTDESEALVGTWYFADVMYIYVWTRIHELDPYLVAPIKCPVCGYMGVGKFDLRDSDVDVVESVEDLQTIVTLDRGFKLRDQTLVKKVTLCPVTWAVMYQQGAAAGTLSSGGYAQLQHSICAVNDREHYTPLVEELDELRKPDMVKLDRAAGKVSAGLDLIISIDCPGKNEKAADGKCSFKINRPLDWSFDYFFDSPSLSETLTT